MQYTSTRDNSVKVTASQAILQGLSHDGGLFVPVEVPTLDIPLDKLADLSYQETAYRVMSKYFTDFTEEELRYCVDHAYDNKFDTDVIAPLKKAGNAWFLELYHGKTIAFKDMALSILPYLMTTSAKKNHVTNKIVILTATSGDTGKAALAGFADVPGTEIIVFYPKHGVSVIQERQMLTQEGDNTHVVGIIGNFDDAQSGVKKMFSDKALSERMNQAGYQFSSANSINIGRLIPQVAYYVYAYGQLLKQGAIKAGETMNVTVPTGNFGNILAAHYAKRMGLPIGKLICASNENKVLYDFFCTGTYDKNREFMLTSSPSMDILISSNLERLIYEMAECDSAANKSLMDQLSSKGVYSVTNDMRLKADDFVGGYTDEKQTAEEIKRVFDENQYLIDTHTAVASRVYQDYVKTTGDKTPNVIASTASPYKFTRSVMTALKGDLSEADDFALADELCSICGVTIPEAVSSIRHAPILHDTVVDKSEMQDIVEKILSL